FAPARRLRRDVRIEESWSMLGPYRWLVERSSTGSDSAGDFQSLGPQPLWRKSGASALPRTSLPLTEPSLLSRGTRRSRIPGYPTPRWRGGSMFENYLLWQDAAKGPIERLPKISGVGQLREVSILFINGNDVPRGAGLGSRSTVVKDISSEMISGFDMRRRGLIDSALLAAIPTGDAPR